MGAIYATAEVTLIAAAGEDPNYGLPGISKFFSDCHFPDENTANKLVRASKWSSRGWTLQEEILSRRRLFFTNAGIQIVCSYSSHSMVNEDIFDKSWWLRFDTSERSILEKSRGILQAYTARELTYASDALNAIVGVFNAFHKQQSSWNHIWGVPYFTEERYRDSDVVMAIDWLGHDLERRPEYPSWSPLGWKSSSSMNIREIPVSHDDFQISCWNHEHFEELWKIAYAKEDIQTDTRESQRMQLTAYCIVLDGLEWRVSKDGRECSSKKKLQVAIDTHLEIACELCSKGFDATVQSAFLAVFKSPASGEGFILRWCLEECYERVGYFRVTRVQRDGFSPASWDWIWDWNTELCSDLFHSEGSHIKKKTIIWV